MKINRGTKTLTLLLTMLMLMILLQTSAMAANPSDLETPLTLEAITDGTIVVSNPKRGMQYSLNGGAKTAVSDVINVTAGDKVQFFGNGTDIISYNSTSITGGTAECYIYGNIMSLLDETGFPTAVELKTDEVFYALFMDNSNLFNHSTRELLLPATTLTKNCYEFMFYYCTGLTKAPVLPAATLADNCYSGMFLDCSGLTEAPELPAMNLAVGCYSSMFSGCSGLTEAPVLPAKNLKDNCYDGMFSGCIGLTEAPVLPATDLADYCYDCMFSGCEGLTEAPVLPATTLTQYCYHSMFQNCTGLTEAPALSATTLADSCYYGMFENCTGLIEAPVLPATNLEKNCYVSMFEDCTSLTKASALPATTLADSCYERMFCGCSSLTEAPELPATNLADSCYERMFCRCSSLTEAPALPATTLAGNCYDMMFYGCTGLTKAPVLPAPTLVYGCYEYMFENCSSLNTVTCLATDISATYATEEWINGVPGTGSFIKAAAMDSWSSGSSGIPKGWKVKSHGVHITGVTLDKSALTVEKGETATLTATIEPADAEDDSVTWTSDNESVATVDANGLVIAVGGGRATITVTTNDGGFTATCTVTVLYAFGTPDFILPADTLIIENNAFEGDAMTVVDASGCTAIGAEAFKDCTGLTQIRLPKDCDIGTGAFSGCGKIQVYAPAGGTTETWCEANGVLFTAE